jgi:hypothetical protein
VERKVLTGLLDRVRDGEVKDIFVQDISRLSRNSDVSHDILRILRDTKSKRGRVWTPNGVDRILKSEVYKGTRYYKGTNNEERIETKVPSLISEESWSLLQETTQKRVKTGRKRQRRHPVNTYLLKGLCLCRKCGGTLWGKVQRKDGRINHQVYFCKSKDKREERKRGKCEFRGINYLCWKMLCGRDL